MSKISKRNYVKRHMDKIHKPKIEDSGKVYIRRPKFRRGMFECAFQERMYEQEVKDNDE